MNATVKLLELVLPATVSLQVEVPEEHPSAAILGTTRLASGVIIDPDGLVLTVNYAVLGASRIEVALLDDRTLPGRLVAHDFASGLAVVAVSGEQLPARGTVAVSTLHAGQEVFIVAAIGENRRRTASGSIFSLGAFDAYWEYALDPAITSTASNPGLGGAPLFDAYGRVAGIVSLDLAEVGRLTLAIPTDPFSEHREELLRHGHRVTRPPRAWIGLYCYTMQERVVIAGVLPGAPGDEAGLRPGDVVLEIDGQPITDRRALYARLWTRRPGDAVEFRVYRNNQVRQVTVPSGNAEEFFA